MRDGELEVADGATAGAWIKPRLGGEFGAVTLEVPKGYEAYARIFHSASDLDGNPVRWAEVADVLGMTPHREMQWHAILGLLSSDELRGSYEAGTAIGSQWTGHDPPIGEMDLEELDALCEILAGHTADPSHCYFGLCTIQSWMDSFSADELKPLLKLPWDRDHIVLAGPLSAVDQIVRDWSKTSSSETGFAIQPDDGPPPDSSRIDWTCRESPNLIWPADRTWLVASEVDFDSTLVGGSRELIKTIIDSSAFEAWQVEPTDSLAADADKINGASAPSN